MILHSNVFGRKTMARFAVAGMTGSLAMLALAGPASAGPMSRYPMNVPDCKTSGQICSEQRTVSRSTGGEPVRVEFFADPAHCSDVIVHLIVDGEEWGSNTVSPGQSDGGYEVPLPKAGLHFFAVQVDGIRGGCNKGKLASWKGALEIENLV